MIEPEYEMTYAETIEGLLAPLPDPRLASAWVSK